MVNRTLENINLCPYVELGC